MPTPPVLTAEQRAKARRASLEVRQERAALKRMITAGEINIHEAWNIWQVAGGRVLELLTALPTIGPMRARRMMAEAGIHERKRVRACGPTQTRKLFELLEGRQ